MHGEGEQIRVVEALADLGGLRRGGDRGIVVTRSLVLEHRRQQHVAVLDAVMLLAVEQPLRAAQPSAGSAHLASAGEIYAHPERAAHGAQSFARVHVCMMGALQVAQVLVVVADHVGRGRQQLEVLRSQWGRLIGIRQRLVGVPPRPPRVGLTALFELVHRVHHCYSVRHRAVLRLVGAIPAVCGLMGWAASAWDTMSKPS